MAVEVRKYIGTSGRAWYGVVIDGKAGVHKFMTKGEAEQYARLLPNILPPKEKT